MCFRERVRSFLFDGVLGCDREERFGQLVRVASDGDFAFLHGLQKRGLSLGRSSIDFVGQQDVGEDRAFDKSELAFALRVFLEDVRTRDVGWHQVGGELDAFEIHVQDLGQRGHHQRFGEAWHAFEQAVTFGEDGCEELFDHLVLADDHFSEFAPHLIAVFAELSQ